MKITPTIDSIQQVQAYVEQLLDDNMVPMKIAMKIGIVIDEIYSNIVSYSQASEAEVLCSITPEMICLQFVDNGTPYNPLEAEDPDITLNAEERQLGGLGIFITRKIMDTMDYLRENENNIVTMSIHDYRSR